ncbi:pyridoxal-dependent decarboxylase [Verrucomicrobium spinosum]|uniref:pyridoxal-dependent decarboxylase n=1 Tax=Verrucomicrobium spinosum TaxID=2736 RepID=UPI000A6A8802|nr:pyridoxal-dependent decarboxylase [Verrucomicrobium spinosum]
MDYSDLRETLRIHRDVPPIIFANIGTTMKGAVDNLHKIRAILDELAITNAYLHADAALSGMILPFVADPQPWDFAGGADSISISGHKFLGSPLPCGVFSRGNNMSNGWPGPSSMSALWTPPSPAPAAPSHPCSCGTACTPLGSRASRTWCTVAWSSPNTRWSSSMPQASPRGGTRIPSPSSSRDHPRRSCQNGSSPP